MSINCELSPTFSQSWSQRASCSDCRTKRGKDQVIIQSPLILTSHSSLTNLPSPRSYAKQLIKDTIRRNESPVRLDSAATGANGSSSSLASSQSDELQQQAAFRLERNHSVGGALTSGASSGKAALARVASVGSSLPQSSYTNVGDYKYTVSVGSHDLKITGDCAELVRVAKLVLDDYFSGQEFLGAADAVPITPVSESKLNPFAAPVVPPSHQIGASRQSAFVDSGIGLNLLGQANVSMDDDEVFIVESGEWGFCLFKKYFDN